MKNVRSFIKQIEKYKYVSFDLFDTLILKNVNKKEDIFSIVESRLKLEKIDINDFARKRVQAEDYVVKKIKRIEKKAEEELVKKQLDKTDENNESKVKKIDDDSNKAKEEINKDDVLSLSYIYSYIEFKDDMDRKRAIDIEKEVIVLYSRFNSFFEKILAYAKSSFKKIIITSDSPYDEETIHNVLKKNRIKYDYLYLYNKNGYSKKSGRLFQFILNDLDIKKDEAVHVGSNKNHESGKVREYPYLIYKNKYPKKSCNYIKRLKEFNLGENIVLSYLKKSDDTLSEIYNLGFNVFGPFLYGMCQWIHDEALKDNLDNIYFLENGGLILKKAYEIMYDTEKCHYLHVSKRSLSVPLLARAEDLADIFYYACDIGEEECIEKFLYKIGIPNESILCDELKAVYKNGIHKDDFTMGQYEDIYFKIKNKVKMNSKTELINCSRYLKDHVKGSKIGVIDVGYDGIKQSYMKKILKENNYECDIYGYYLGYLDEAKNRSFIDYAKSYIYTASSKKKYNFAMINGYIGMLDMFFSSDKGRVKNYISSEKSIVPKLEEWKNESFNLVSQLQSGALNFISGIEPLMKYGDFELSKEFSFYALNKLLTMPQHRDIDLFENALVYDEEKLEYRKLINFKGYRYYVLHLYSIYKDYKKSCWKIAYLEKVMQSKVLGYIFYSIIKKCKNHK